MGVVNTQKKRGAILWIADMLIIAVSVIIMVLAVYYLTKHREEYEKIINTIILSMGCFSVFMCFGRIYSNPFGINIRSYIKLLVYSVFADIVILSIIICTMYALPDKAVFLSPGLAFISLSFATLVVASAHVFIKYTIDFLTSARKNAGAKRLLIVGAGSAATMLIDEIENNEKLNYTIVGLVDDDLDKKGHRLKNYKVLGTGDDIMKICEEKNVDEIIIAIPSLSNIARARLISICNETNCRIKKIPHLTSRVESIYRKVRDIHIDDILSREEVVLNNKELELEINGKVILVSGGGGSIGSELCRQIAKFNPRLLIILDIYENNAYDLLNELTMGRSDFEIQVVIASVRDKVRINEVLDKYKPDIIFHAAAHKHVPLMEANPSEAIKNNVFGTYNMAECAVKNGVKKFVMISTDKAVNPTNVMGATKRLCEMIVSAMQNEGDTEFVAVRFGNVLGSNGSVVPLFKRQIENGGPVTVTDKEITRFFMTIPEAAQLVLQASTYARGGEIFVLDMGEPVKIYDLACNIIKLAGYVPNEDIKIEITGLRPGEKLYEELLMDQSGLKSTRHKSIFIEPPEKIELSDVKTKLDALRDAVEKKDDVMIVDVLTKAVPTYKRSVYKSPKAKLVTND